MPELSLKELKELAVKARKAGDEKLELEILETINRATMPKMQATEPGIIEGPRPTVEPRFKELPNASVGVSTEGLMSPKDMAIFAGGTLGSTLMPGLTIPAMASRAGRMVAPFARNLPKIAGAGFGAGGTEAGGEMMLNDEAQFADIMRQATETAKDYALAETAGVGTGAILSKGVEKFFGSMPEGMAKEALKFAEKNKAPLPLSLVKDGAGGTLEKASDITFFGNMIRRRSADKINKTIEQTVNAITPYAKTPEVVAPRAQTLLKETLAGATDAKNVAYKEFETAIGKDTVVSDSTIKDAALEALNIAKAQGKRITGPLKELENFANYEGPRTFNDLERFRKDTLNKVTGNFKTKEVGQPVEDALNEVYRQLGKEKGFDLNKSIEKASSLMNELKEIKKIPGIQRFSKIEKSEAGWIVSFVNENNSQALNLIKEKAPDTYRSLIEQRLALSFFDKNKEWSPDGFVKFVKDNPKFIQETYGSETKTVLNNFADYIETTSDFVKKKSKIIDAASGLGGAGVMGSLAGAFRSPELILASETSGAALALMLTNPNNPIYKVFSQTDPIKVGTALQELTPFVTRSMVQQYDGQ